MTGLGLGLFEYAEARHGGRRVRGVNFSSTEPVGRARAERTGARAHGARDGDHGDGPGGDFRGSADRDSGGRAAARRPAAAGEDHESRAGGFRSPRAATATATRTVSGASRWPCAPGKRNDAAPAPLEFDALDDLLDAAGRAIGRHGVRASDPSADCSRKSANAPEQARICLRLSSCSHLRPSCDNLRRLHLFHLFPMNHPIELPADPFPSNPHAGCGRRERGNLLPRRTRSTSLTAASTRWRRSPPQSLSSALDGFGAGVLMPAARLWEEIARRDETIASVKAKREEAVAQRDWTVQPLDESPAALDQAAALGISTCTCAPPTRCNATRRAVSRCSPRR